MGGEQVPEVVTDDTNPTIVNPENDPIPGVNGNNDDEYGDASDVDDGDLF